MRPTANLLELLEVLQSRPVVSGAEAARRLGVDRRTVRRYVSSLQELGIPVQGARGAGGGYRLAPGFRLPPLMLEPGEAAAVVLALLAARRHGTADASALQAALAKLRRVLPVALRARIEALDAVAFSTGASAAPGTAPSLLLDLAQGVHRRRRLRLEYRSAAGEQTVRQVSPHGLVAHAGRWYLVATDHGVAELRTFRADRVLRCALLPDAAVAPPEDFDPAEHLVRALARVPWRWEVEVVLDMPLELARRSIAPSLAELSAEGERTRLIMRADSLDWAAAVLAGLGCELELRRPPELGAALRALGERLVRNAAPGRSADTSQTGTERA